MKIKFIESHGFMGETMRMIVDEISHTLINKFDGIGDYKDHAIFILKNAYDIEMKKDDIIFEWDGTL